MALFGLWLLVCPYPGITGDAMLYVGKVLAHLDPAGVGRDIIFSKDGQMQFSVFPKLLGGVVHLLGLSRAAEAVSFSAVVLWFLAASVLAFQLAEGRARWITLLFILLAPTLYGYSFHFGDAIAVPRPFAEALVLLALAAILREKPVLAGALLVGAALLHPIMALPGFGMLFLNLLHRDNRWLLLALPVLLLFGLAEILQVPLLDRLFVIMDAKWWAILEQYNYPIFPLVWGLFAYSQLAVQVTTLIVAIWALEQRYRLFFLHVLMITSGGLAIAVLFGDLMHNELVVQAQLWRSLWLAAVLAPAALALLLVQAKAKTPQDWIVPTLVATAWLPTSATARFIMCGSALVLLMLPHARLKIPELYAVWAVRLVLLFGIVNNFSIDINYLSKFYDKNLPIVIVHLASAKMNLFGWPVCLFSFFIIDKAKIKISLNLRYFIAFVLFAVGIRFWDGRTSYRKQVDAARPVTAFAAIIATRPGPVYWVGGRDEAWFWLRRANWYSKLQERPIVFSRQQALHLEARAERVVKFGLEPSTILHPFATSKIKERLPHLTAAKVAGFCAAPDAPPWIVWPLAAGNSLMAGGIVARAIWQMTPSDMLMHTGHAGTLRSVTAFALIGCHPKAA